MMHLQWFADADPNGTNFEEASSETEYEVLVKGQDEMPVEPSKESPESQKLSREEILQKLADAESARAKLSTQADSTTLLAQGFEKLNQTLSKQPAQQQLPLQETDEQFTKRFKETFLDDPAGMNEEFINRTLRDRLLPDIQQIMANNRVYSKEFAKMDKDTADILKLYPQEVEEVINTFSPLDLARNPHIYKEAAKHVKLHHLDEIIKLQVDSALAETRARTPSPLAHGEFNQRPARTVTTLKATYEDQEAAMKKNMAIEDYMLYKTNKNGGR